MRWQQRFAGAPRRTARRSVLVLTGSLALGAGVSGSSPAAPTLSAELSHRAYRQWSIEVPDEQWFPVSGGIGIAHAADDVFAAGLDGTDLRLDTDGDGTLDRTIRAKADDYGVRRARVVLRGERPDGAAFKYGVRLRHEGAGWMWAPGSVRAGSIATDGGDVPVRLIDRNGNGRWNDVGADAMVVGAGDAASFLSSTIFLDGRLWALEVGADGARLDLRPFDGPTARLDMTTDFDAKARLLSAVVRSRDGAHSFELAPFDEPITVPAGAYDIVTGRIGLGRQSVRIAGGRADTIALSAGETHTFDWGGPVRAEFEYRRTGEEVVFDPNAIWYYGAAGEEYLDWRPIGKSPEFTIRNKADGQVLEVLILPGSC